MLMFISFPVPHVDGSVNFNHKKGECPSGHCPFLFIIGYQRSGRSLRSLSETVSSCQNQLSEEEGRCLNLGSARIIGFI